MRDGEGEAQKPRKVMTRIGCSEEKQQIKKIKTSLKRKVEIFADVADDFISPERPLHTVNVS